MSGFARTLVEKMPALVSFSTTSSALLAERMHAMRREAELRETIAAILEARSFHPVFQPIVDLESGEVVGYEALTRFESGQRPDRASPTPGRWAWARISRSPRLKWPWPRRSGCQRDSGSISTSRHACSRIRSACAMRCRAAERPIVLEITEHDIIDELRSGARGGPGSRARRPPGGRRRGCRGRELRPHHRTATRLREARHQPRAAA